MKWLRSTKKDIPIDDRLKPGMVFEKYTVEKQLGQGGMGSVYLVRHNVLDSQFALKILSSDVASKNKQFVDRFIREAKLACKIRHPNLIAVHDAGQNPQNGLYYIVMDYVPGGSVRDRLKKTRSMPPDQALRIITQVADALAAACAHHMVHRDIKPDNIMFAADGSAKLADLGIAKSTDEQDTMITMASSVFGTPAYMSPEQAKDSSKVDSRADIYSLGIVFYEMLSGHRPFSGTSAIQILSQVMDASRIPDVRLICPETPPELADLIARMVEKNVENRIQSPALLVQELKKIQIPAHLAGRPLRVRDELAATSSAVPLTAATMPTAATAPAARATPSAPDVTMPTMADAPASAPEPPPAPDVTMPTMADAPASAPEPPPAPEVTMPTMADAPASAPEPPPAPDVTMPTMADAPVSAPAPEPVAEEKPLTVAEAPVSEPVPEVKTPTVEETPAPAPVEVTMQTISETPAPAPVSEPVPEVKTPMVEETPAPEPVEVTMPTMADAPVSAPAPEPVAEVKNPTVVDAPPPAPDVTMQTIASATPAPAPEPVEVTMRTIASAPKPPEPDVTAPMRTAAPPSEVKKAAPAAEKKAPSPVADAPQKKSKRGVIVVSAIAVASLVIVSGAIFAAVLMFKGGSSAEPPQNTVPVQPENTNTQPGGTSATIADSTAVTPRSGTNTTPDAGPVVTDTASAAGQSAPAAQQNNGSATGTKPALDAMTPGPLRKNQIVLLSDTSSLSRQAKRALSEAFGAEKVSFQEAEGMGSYKQLLKDIVKSEPSIVVLCFAQQYADDGISASGFENVIAFHADQFRENGIPFLFVQPVRDDDDARIRAYIDVTTELCRQRSISFVSAEDVTGGKLVSLVLEDKKAE